MKKIYHAVFGIINIVFSVSSMDFSFYDVDNQILSGALNKSLLDSVLRNESIDKIKFLLKAGADINAQTDFGATSLFIAATKGYIDILKVLIEYGADINIKTRLGQTLLHNLNVFKHEKIMEILIEKGISVDARDENGVTPLHRAAAQGGISAVKFFIEKGANIEVLDCMGCTPLHYFCDKSEIDFIGAKGVEILTTVPMVFRNIKSVDLSKNKELLNKLDIFTFSFADKVFALIKILPDFIIKLVASFVFPVKNAIESKYVEKFALKCYMNPDKNLSKLFITELYVQHLLKLNSYIVIKNKAQASALNLASINNQKNIVTYLNRIDRAQKYDDLDEYLRNIIEKNYKDRLDPKDNCINK